MVCSSISSYSLYINVFIFQLLILSLFHVCRHLTCCMSALCKSVRSHSCCLTYHRLDTQLSRNQWSVYNTLRQENIRTRARGRGRMGWGDAIPRVPYGHPRLSMIRRLRRRKHTLLSCSPVLLSWIIICRIRHSQYPKICKIRHSQHPKTCKIRH